MMYDRNKVLIGLAVFVVAMTYPFWNNIGSAAYKRPEVEKPRIGCEDDGVRSPLTPSFTRAPSRGRR